MMRRYARALVAALAFIATGAALTAPPAAASLKPDVLVKPGPAFTKTYSAIPGQGPTANYSSRLNDPKPAECVNPPGATYCDVIPVRVQLPSDYDDNSDEFITRVTLSWPEPAEKSDDMDLFIYNARDVLTGKSANGSIDPNDPTSPNPNPEVSGSADAKFKVVVSNLQGPNQGYSLKFLFILKRFTPVTERPSTFGAGNNSGSSTPSARPTPSVRPTPSSPVSPSFGGPVAAALDLPPLDLTDPDFAAGAGSDLTSGLFGGAAKSVVQTRPAKPVSAGILIAMLGVLPLITVGAGGVFFRRRASRLLQF